MTRFYILIFLATLMFSCSKDLEETSMGSSTSMRDRNSDSNCDVSYSFTLGETSNLQVLKKPFEEFCEVDMMSIASSYQTNKNVTICHNERGETCLFMENSQSTIRRGTNESPDDIQSLSLCDGIATVSTNNGSTETFDTGFEETFLDDFIQGIVHTQEQKDSTLQIMIEGAIAEGAQIEQDENYIILNQLNEDGTITKTYYDKINHIILYTETVDQNGELLSKSIHQYVCVGGYILPDVIVNIDVNTTAICNDTYIRKTIQKFEDYDIIVK